MSRVDVFIHPTAEVSDRAELGEKSRVWNQVQIREDAVIGSAVILSKNVYIDFGVHIGSNVKVQNNVSVFHGVSIEDGVFVGPHVCFTNDRIPRAINADGSPKGADDWVLSKTVVKRGASIGAHSVLLQGIIVGQFAMIGAGSVVTKDVPDHGLVVGNPARVIGAVCYCGARLPGSVGSQTCAECGDVVTFPKSSQ